MQSKFCCGCGVEDVLRVRHADDAEVAPCARGTASENQQSEAAALMFIIASQVAFMLGLGFKT